MKNKKETKDISIVEYKVPYYIVGILNRESQEDFVTILKNSLLTSPIRIVEKEFNSKQSKFFAVNKDIIIKNIIIDTVLKENLPQDNLKSILKEPNIYALFYDKDFYEYLIEYLNKGEYSENKL